MRLHSTPSRNTRACSPRASATSRAEHGRVPVAGTVGDVVAADALRAPGPGPPVRAPVRARRRAARLDLEARGRHAPGEAARERPRRRVARRRGGGPPADRRGPPGRARRGRGGTRRAMSAEPTSPPAAGHTGGVLLRADDEGVVAIGQASHAWLSGQLARAWGGAAVGRGRPPRGGVPGRRPARRRHGAVGPRAGPRPGHRPAGALHRDAAGDPPAPVGRRAAAAVQPEPRRGAARLAARHDALRAPRPRSPGPPTRPTRCAPTWRASTRSRSAWPPRPGSTCPPGRACSVSSSPGTGSPSRSSCGWAPASLPGVPGGRRRARAARGPPRGPRGPRAAPVAVLRPTTVHVVAEGRRLAGRATTAPELHAALERAPRVELGFTLVPS